MNPLNEIQLTRNGLIAKLNGCESFNQTCRSRLQRQRSKLNHEINKELMMRNGAENLFKATRNKKLREVVALELSFVNSNLQLLKEQLSDLNGLVGVYQNENCSKKIPLIPLGLKETKDIDFSVSIKEFISQHYREDGEKYNKEIQTLTNMRKAVSTPSRTSSGTAVLCEYYNHLFFVERRFIPPDQNLGLFFEWFDSLTGVPSCQKVIAFEKACVLFNLAALYTQIGAHQDRNIKSEICHAIDNFEKAAGVLKYIADNFSNSPSLDMKAGTLSMLQHLMIAQAQECIFANQVLNYSLESFSQCVSLAQEASQVAKLYEILHDCISATSVKNYVPYSWISMVLVKEEHYKALSHYYAGVGMTLEKDVSEHVLCHLYQLNAARLSDIVNLPTISLLGKAHLRESILLHEESIRLHRMCKQLRKIDTLFGVLKDSHDESLNKYSDMEEEDEFFSIIDPPLIKPFCRKMAAIQVPNFTQFKVIDLFNKLGPITIFSARHSWSAPRTITLCKNNEKEFGFTVRGDSPVIIAEIFPGSVAEKSGMKEGDFIVQVADIDTKWATHVQVVTAFKNLGDYITVQLITPQDRNFLHPVADD